MSLTLDREGVSKATTKELVRWQGILLMCKREGETRMGKFWLKNATDGLPLIAAELQRRKVDT